MRCALALALVLAGCLPGKLDVTGLTCTQDGDCGDGFVCFRGVCATAGSVGEVDLSGPGLSSALTVESGVRAQTPERAPVSFGTLAPVAVGALRGPRAGAQCVNAAGLSLVLGGRSADGGAAAAELLTVLPDGGVSAGLAGPSLGLEAFAAVVAGRRLYVLGGRGPELSAQVLVATALDDAGWSELSATTPLPAPRAELAAVARGGALYAVGGLTGAGLADDVLVAPLLFDGGVGSWTLAGKLGACDGGGCSAGLGRAGHGAALWNDALYVVGGRCGGPCPSLWAEFQPSGALGTVHEFAGLSRERASLSVAAWRGQLVAAGGRAVSGAQVPDVSLAPLTASGAPLPWRAMPTAGPFAEAATCVGDDQLLLAGGAADGGLGAAVRAVGSSRGDFMGFQSHPDLDVPREVASAVAWNGFLYAVGGNDRTVKPPIQKAVVNADGSLGPWTTAGHLLQEGDCTQAVAANGYLYAVGGCDPDNGGPNGNVAWAPFLPNGDVGAFQAGPEIDIPPDNLGWRGLGSVVHAGGFLYVAGYTRSSVVLFSALDRATGKPGPWQATTSLPTVQGVGTAFLSTPTRLYVVAGAEDVFGDYRSDVYTGELASDGRVLGWNRSPYSLPIAVRGMASGVWNGALHVVSGCNGTNYCDGLPEVGYLAPILGDGGVGPWASRGTIPTPRRDPGSAVVQGRLYALGGKKNVPTVEVESAALDPAGVAGPWLAGPALPAAADVGQGASTGEGLALVANEQLLELHDGAWRTLAPLEGRAGAVVAATDTALVVLGGARPTTQVTVARRLPDGGVALTAAPPLPVAQGRTSAVGLGRDVFLLSAAGDAILGARVDDAGALGTFTPRSALPDARPDATLAIGAGTLLLAGGRSEVLGATLLDGGGLGPWRTVGWLPSPRARPLLAVRDGFLYLVSGTRAGAAGADVWSALLSPSGALGPFQNLTSLPSGAARGTAGIGQNALVVAGGAGDAASADVWRAPLWGPRLVGRVSTTLDLERAVSSLDALTVQSSSGQVTVALRTRDADGALGEARAAGAGQGQGAFTPALKSVRGLELLLGLDDGLGSRDGPACRLTGVRAAFTR